MLKVLFAAVASIAMVGGAIAADLPRKEPPPGWPHRLVKRRLASFPSVRDRLSQGTDRFSENSRVGRLPSSHGAGSVAATLISWSGDGEAASQRARGHRNKSRSRA